jgi:hypothetical protein
MSPIEKLILVAVLLAVLAVVITEACKRRKRNQLTREEWIELVRRELIRRHENMPDALPEKVKTTYYGWAMALAETYYDEGPNECTPTEAVESELSYA